jgi:hypothetical protein
MGAKEQSIGVSVCRGKAMNMKPQFASVVIARSGETVEGDAAISEELSAVSWQLTF